MHVQVDEAGQDGQLAASGGGRCAVPLMAPMRWSNCRLPCSQP
jgi:hypothetical protein